MYFYAMARRRNGPAILPGVQSLQTMTEIKKEPELLVLDSHGVYIPKSFCEGYKNYITNFEKVKDDFDICIQGPNHEDYWEAWDSMLNNVEFTNDHGDKLTIGYLPECSDLWAIPEGYEFEEL